MIRKNLCKNNVNAVTVLVFLIGRRDAISKLVRCRDAIWIGLLLVLSAGLARDNGESLLHEPWHLLIPVGASLVTSLILFAAIGMVTRAWIPACRNRSAMVVKNCRPHMECETR